MRTFRFGLLAAVLLLMAGQAWGATIVPSPNATSYYTNQVIKITGAGTTWTTAAPAFSFTGGTVVSTSVVSDTVAYISLQTAANGSNGNTPFTLTDATSGASCGIAVSGASSSTLAYTTEDNLTFAGTIAAGGANSIVTGGKDVTGNSWQVASGKLSGTKATGSITGNEWLFLGAGKSVNQVVSCSWVGSDMAGGFPTLLLRAVTGGTVTSGIVLVLSEPASTGTSFSLTYYNQLASGSFNQLSFGTSGTGFNSGATYAASTDTYKLEGFAIGQNPTNIYYRLTDVTTATILKTSVPGDAGAGVSQNSTLYDAPGYCGITQRTSGAKYTAASSQNAPFAFGLPVISRTSFSGTSIAFSTTAPTGAVGSVSYQWHRSTTPGFAPTGSAGSGTSLAGATATTLTDTPPTNNIYYYKCVATDSAATSNIIDSLDFPSQTWQTGYVIGFIGDSLEQHTPTDGSGNTNFVTDFGVALGRYNGLRKITLSNQGVPSTQTSDWGIAGAFYPSTTTAFAAASVQYVCYQLGTNDAGFGVSQATYLANTTAIVNDLVSKGYKVLLGYPPYRFSQAGPVSTTNALLLSYQSSINSLVNNTTVFLGPDMYTYESQHPEDFETDGLHDVGAGVKSYATLWAASVAKVLGLTAALPVSRRFVH